MKKIALALIPAAALLVTAASAQAYGYHGHGHRHKHHRYHDHHRSSFSFYYSAPVGYYYEPATMVYDAPVYTVAPANATPAGGPPASQSGEYCREYQKTVRVGGHLEEGYGTACMQPDGSWKMQN